MINLINQIIPTVSNYFNPNNNVPWLEQKKAKFQLEKQLKQQAIELEKYQILQQWMKEGYVIVKNIIPETIIDNLVQQIDNLFFQDEVIEGLRIEGIQYQDFPASLTHAEILSLNHEVKTSLSDAIWRIHAFHEHSKYAQEIFDNPQLQELVSLILGKKSLPKYSINFRHGTEQGLHEDMAVFYINPANFLVGVWIALEDISEDAGPLVFCPRSHKDVTVKDFFANYPEINLKNIEAEKMPLYTEYVNKRAEKFPQKQFIAHKGDILLWHGMLIHGGAKINNPALTRKSMVIHFVGEDCDWIAHAKGPFNW